MGNSTVPTISVGQTKELGAAMIKAIPTDLPFSLAQRIIGKKGELGSRIRDVLETFDDGKIQRLSFPVTIGSSQTLQQMIDAYPYRIVNINITPEHFPMKEQGKRQIEVTLFHFNRTISSDDAIAEMVKEGFRLADPEELINLSGQHPGQDLQKELPIVALGSPWQDSHGNRRVVCLGRGDGAERILSLNGFEGDWGGSWRFAAVCN